MAFDFDALFQQALGAGLEATRPGHKAAEAWLKECTAAHEQALRDLADGVAGGQISKSGARMLLEEETRAMRSEAAALSVIMKSTAQAGVNAFIGSLTAALESALGLAP